MKAHARPLAAALFSTAVLSSLAYAQATADITPAKVQEGAYTVEPLHTRVLFAVSHIGFTTWCGEFTHVSGSLTPTPKPAADSTFEIHIPTNTISTSDAKLDGEAYPLLMESKEGYIARCDQASDARCDVQRRRHEPARQKIHGRL